MIRFFDAPLQNNENILTMLWVVMFPDDQSLKCFVLSQPKNKSKLINKLMNILEINAFSPPLHQRRCQSL